MEWLKHFWISFLSTDASASFIALNASFLFNFRLLPELYLMSLIFKILNISSIGANSGVKAGIKENDASAFDSRFKVHLALWILKLSSIINVLIK